MKLIRWVLCFLGLISFVACSSVPSRGKYSQAELNAIETREVQSSFKDTFSAASNALFDAGYTIQMSDRDGGLLTGYKGKDNTAARIWISPFIGDTKF